MAAKPLEQVTAGDYCTRPALKDRPLLSPMQAGQLMGLFKVLSNDTRLRLLHQLCRVGECGVTALAETVGMSPQAVSNQLQKLSDWGILASRREGNTIHYRIVDSCIAAVLDLGLCLMEESNAAKRT
jgi:ArsR family transcriptional regulator, lead/cadmium/zinc/bismuth-responsive transcriptional repressor